MHETPPVIIGRQFPPVPGKAPSRKLISLVSPVTLMLIALAPPELLKERVMTLELPEEIKPKSTGSDWEIVKFAGLAPCPVSVVEMF